MSAVEHGTMTLLPPKADVCQECATDHRPSEPHNAQSLYYQVAFQMREGRSPDWRDAMAHCDEPTKQRWTEELSKLGVDVAAGQVNPPRKAGKAGAR